ncbi:thiamine phosphate synthase [Gelidibacter sp.]|uniref:thiamine phosphate synthase n=1 Tax=Gelidibacter sp. TaxID=2018083 RepID=UPI002C0C8684|nr:thiamine phosphate synthase [Gelidibacter sp.]HUH29238.1 hypothetical protein [Gelidibacter sp.]
MMVLLSPKFDIENEIQILNQLFIAGLECYHLRKPDRTRQEYVDLLKEIDPKYHNRIVIHQFHELTNDFNLKGIHFEEQQRRNYIETPTRYFKDLKLFGKTISSTFHELNDLVDSDFEFDYHFLWPLFSLGKQPNSEVNRIDVNHVDKGIIAVGDLDKKTFYDVFTLGYRGIAILETVWQSKDPLTSFTDLKTVYDTIIIKP